MGIMCHKSPLLQRGSLAPLLQDREILDIVRELDGSAGHRHSSLPIKEGKKYATVCVSTHTVWSTTTTLAQLRFLSRLDGIGSPVAQVISQNEKSALEMRETRRLCSGGTLPAFFRCSTLVSMTRTRYTAAHVKTG